MSKKSITVILAVALLGFGSLAFAHWNGGYGYPGWMHGGYGMYGMHGGYYGDQGYGYQGNLNEDQINALQKEQDAFLKETEATRQDLYAKQLALESELAKNNPDAAKGGIKHLPANGDTVGVASRSGCVRCRFCGHSRGLGDEEKGGEDGRCQQQG